MCWGVRSCRQHGVERARAFQRVQFVTAADAFTTDEDLRDGVAALRPLHHFGALGGVETHVIFGEGDALLLQKVLGAQAIGAEGRGINLDGFRGHKSLHVSSYITARDYRTRRDWTTRASVRTDISSAPALASALAQAPAVAPVVNTSSMR